MARTTDEAVREIMDVDPGITDLEPFITPANALVTEVCAVVDTYDDERLELIERWLAAHFVCMRDPRYVTEKADRVQATYQSKVDLFLSTSHYGQMAMVLDTAGGLKALNKNSARRTMSVTWLGTPLDD